MAKVRVGLDIGATAVRAAELQGGDTPVVVRAAQVPLPEGAVEAGEIRQPELVSEALRELWQRGGFKSRQVYMGVGNQRVVVREIALPWLPEKELRASLGFQAQEFIPMPVEDAVLDFDPLGEFEQEGRRMLRLILVAAQRAMVNTVVDVALAAKLEPIGRRPGAVRHGSRGRHAGGRHGGRRGWRRGHRRHRRHGHEHPGPREGRDAVRPDPAVGRPGHHVGDRPELRGRGRRRRASEARRGGRGRSRPGRGASRRDAAGAELRRRGAVLARVLHGADARSPDRAGPGDRRRARSLQGFLELLQERVPATIERGHVFRRAKSQLSLSEEALAEAEPVLAVAVGLGIPGRHFA